MAFVDDILDAAGLTGVAATQRDVAGEPVIVVKVTGDGPRLWTRVRDAVRTHYPVLVDDVTMALDRDFFGSTFFDVTTPGTPSELLARAAAIDVDARIAEISAERAPVELGTGDEPYHLDAYDVAHFGPPECLVILPRPEPWAAFAYLVSFAIVGGYEPELLVAAARRWHERYGAEPNVVGLATGFVVPRPPTSLEDAERLALEHDFLAGLTLAGTSVRSYARALLQLDRWALYNRP
jgi:hypothetical protein